MSFVGYGRDRNPQKDHTIHKMKTIKQILATATFTLGLGFAVMAQIPPPPTPTAPPTQVPLDGGILLLAGAGAIYGAKKVYDKRKYTRK